MREYVIVTDVNGDLPSEYVREHGVYMMSTTCTMGDVTEYCDQMTDFPGFYAKMRGGAKPLTGQVTPAIAMDTARPILEAGQDILFLCFSSALSGSYNSTCVAVDELRDEFPDAKMVVIDSLCASMGQGLLVYHMVRNKEAGMSLEELAEWTEKNKHHVMHYFTVEDLFHLYRGGRLSKAGAIVGSLLSVKPLLYVDSNGGLKPFGKVRGRKKSLTALAEHIVKSIKAWPREENPIILISHGDCPEDVAIVQEEIKKELGDIEFLVHYIGPSVGTHSGPGTVAVFCMGPDREVF
ncbi:MAG: DegV family protein [Lachnospiraceae bacterium]|nr:DegV family protein [Lachnospiraceae bacterium]MDY5741397.1 DegV family protein [Lachnospiraceae bacterium]